MKLMRVMSYVSCDVMYAVIAWRRLYMQWRVNARNDVIAYFAQNLVRCEKIRQFYAPVDYFIAATK